MSADTLSAPDLSFLGADILPAIGAAGSVLGAIGTALSGGSPTNGGTTGQGPFSTIYAFGDSLSDAGNISRATLGAIPASPPYVDGHFSNGQVWVQDLAQNLGLGPLQPSLGGGTDFAFGGADTGSTPVHTANPTDLPGQFAQFVVQNPVPQANALYAIWIGSNDVFSIVGQPGQTPAQASSEVSTAVRNEASFIAALAPRDGVKDLMVVNVPDLGKTPVEIAAGPAASAAATSLALQYDADLASAVRTLTASGHLKIDLVDSFGLVDGVIANAGPFGFTNVTDPVWTGNFTDPSSGTLRATTPGAQNQFLFWDVQHPTAGAHSLLGAYATQTIARPWPSSARCVATTEIPCSRVALRQQPSAPRTEIGMPFGIRRRLASPTQAALLLALLCLLAACGGPARHGAGLLSAPRRSYPPPGPPDDPWQPYIREAASRFGVPEPWIRSVMRQESGEQEGAVSTAGAMGLMQVMPETYAAQQTRYGLGNDPFEPHDNIIAGAAYIREMYDRYGSPGFLAAYNAGPNRLDSYLAEGSPLPDETVGYLSSIAPRLGTELPATGPLAVYSSVGTALSQPAAAASAPVPVPYSVSASCDLDAAYDPDRQCTPAPATARPGASPIGLASATTAGCDPDTAYDPDRPCAAATAAMPATSPAPAANMSVIYAPNAAPAVPPPMPAAIHLASLA
ncbi:MAG: SGNH/GDSL hydrolase family protein, partial [Pseudomonadota bacterium]|nr:SGNH/GDSL hydrolase family protein [Pseudomonadota bacterium]